MGYADPGTGETVAQAVTTIGATILKTIRTPSDVFAPRTYFVRDLPSVRKIRPLIIPSAT